MISLRCYTNNSACTFCKRNKRSLCVLTHRGFLGLELLLPLETVLFNLCLSFLLGLLQAAIFPWEQNIQANFNDIMVQKHRKLNYSGTSLLAQMFLFSLVKAEMGELNREVSDLSLLSQWNGPCHCLKNKTRRWKIIK